MSKTILVGNGVVATLDGTGKVIENGGVLIRGETIAAVGETEALRKEAESFVDAGGRLIVPGMICAHHHLYSTFACGMGFEPAANFVQVLEHLWWKLDRALDLEDVYYSALIPLARCIQSGTTTIIDHHASPAAIPGSLGRIGDAVKETGLRASLCYEVTDRNGAAGAEAGIAENEAWLEQSKSDPMLHGLVGVHAAMTVSAQTLDRCVAVANRHDSGLHIHVAEDQADQDHSEKEYQKRVVVRLHEAGGLGPKTLAAHCVHVDDKEVDLLRGTNTVVLHQPQSNMNNGVGCADVPRLLGAGIRVCLGTDGMTSNMLEEARASLFVRHHATGDPSVGFGETIQMLENNASVASSFFGTKLGVLEAGAAADVVIRDYVPFTPVTGDNAYGHLLFGAAAHGVDTTICAGRILMQNGEIQTLDLAEISAATRERTSATWKRVQNL